jgi:hypothetical protein
MIKGLHIRIVWFGLVWFGFSQNPPHTKAGNVDDLTDDPKGSEMLMI